MRMVVSLGGKALHHRGRPEASARHCHPSRAAARMLATLADRHTLVITHDLGRLIHARLAHEVGLLLGHNRVVTLLGRTLTNHDEPPELVDLPAIHHLSRNGFLVFCAGADACVSHGPSDVDDVASSADNDLSAASIARQLQADCLLLLTDVAAVYSQWGTAQQRRIRCAHPHAIDTREFPAASMGPKLGAARLFAINTGRPAYIGALDQALEVLDGGNGTCIKTGVKGIRFSFTPRAAAARVSSLQDSR